MGGGVSFFRRWGVGGARTRAHKGIIPVTAREVVFENFDKIKSQGFWEVEGITSQEGIAFYGVYIQNSESKKRLCPTRMYINQLVSKKYGIWVCGFRRLIVGDDLLERD